MPHYDTMVRSENLPLFTSQFWPCSFRFGSLPPAMGAMLRPPLELEVIPSGHLNVKSTETLGFNPLVSRSFQPSLIVPTYIAEVFRSSVPTFTWRWSRSSWAASAGSLAAADWQVHQAGPPRPRAGARGAGVGPTCSWRVVGSIEPLIEASLPAARGAPIDR
jgi:hypothetical protein